MRGARAAAVRDGALRGGKLRKAGGLRSRRPVAGPALAAPEATAARLDGAESRDAMRERELGTGVVSLPNAGGPREGEAAPKAMGPKDGEWVRRGPGGRWRRAE